MFWGSSEALDLYEEFVKSIQISDCNHLNILLFGSNDPRNIIKTIAKSYNHNCSINFYVLDGCIEIIARNMLLTCLALENPQVLTYLNKTYMFMDIYGNSLIRAASFKYIMSKVRMLTDIITDSNKLEELAPIFDLNNLKYKEKDALQDVFNFWLPREGHHFNIVQCWEERQRATLKTRYDYRDGIFDWDLQMRLKDNAKQICTQEYQHWRETGVAFTFPEFKQSKPNKTLAAGLSRSGNLYQNRGYLGDQTAGPYCAFGLNYSKNPELSESSRGSNEFRSTDVTERNLLELFFEIENNMKYAHNDDLSHKYGNVFLQLDDDKQTEDFTSTDIALDEGKNFPLKSVPNIKVFYISMDEILKFTQNTKFKDIFDLAFISHNYFTLLREDFGNVLKKNSVVLFETKTFSTLKKDETGKFLREIKDFAKLCNLTPLTNFNINRSHFVVKYKNNNVDIIGCQ